MRFMVTEEQADFAASLDALLSSADVVGAARRWADGDHADGLKLWARLAETGLPALLVPEEYGGLGASRVELVIAFEALGRHLVPGPWVESAAYLATALSGEPLTAIADGAVATVATPPHTPYALDADVATTVAVAESDEIRTGMLGEQARSVDPTRRLFEVEAAQVLDVGDRTATAFDTAVLATSAQLIGAGEHLLAESVTYAKQRRQFGREIGSYQALKHALADVRIALDFARPLVYGAALSAGSSDASRDASAAKVAASDAAYLAARTALQVHGAIGYTRELDLSLWILKVRALVGAWGTPAYHRSRILDALVAR
ncbi:acyl-CoA dehydrogenase family protein [Nocardioides speluncae]|uniref:acyl-CoA dehydrogenase family protein n=1 Tax=Nocardioides speluncae TaxID=2670337 RepID=UPI000D6931C9|nr:acyl-CoA dehydrogenase family protein [Nocardioides speluncae]